MDDLWLALRLLGVLTVANNAPIAAKLLLGPPLQPSDRQRSRLPRRTAPARTLENLARAGSGDRAVDAHRPGSRLRSGDRGADWRPCDGRRCPGQLREAPARRPAERQVVRSCR